MITHLNIFTNALLPNVQGKITWYSLQSIVWFVKYLAYSSFMHIIDKNVIKAKQDPFLSFINKKRKYLNTQFIILRGAAKNK